jgi:succinate dehydrogenase/fumarate reductase flavoprotein subunit
MRMWPKVHYTMGGIQIDEQARVINRDMQLIEGLFAAGEVTGGIHGASRLGSCAITECLVFGRIAGRSAAAG